MFFLKFLIHSLIVLNILNIGSTFQQKRNVMNNEFEPAYLKLHRSGELKKRGEELMDKLKSCNLCPRACLAKRTEGKKGFCQAPDKLMISSYGPHYGEERPLVGKGGSGTIFFTHCALRCVFCINWDISHLGKGTIVTIEELANIMLYLQKIGCHNINLVTPDHYLPHIILAIDMAAAKGLKLPIVYNTCGWINIDVLQKLDGIVDIYLPDFKYADEKMAIKYSAGARDYPEITKKALLEMHKQVGVAKPQKDGLIYKGLMIRHLVMPNHVENSKQVLKWIAENLPKDTYVNIMSQYTPVYKAKEYPEIARPITREEYYEVVNYAKQLGLTNLDIQGYRFW